MAFIPTCGYRTTLAEGDIGHDTAALQANLNAWAETQDDEEELEPLVEDGVFAFDGRTYRRVRTYQRRRKIEIDGVAGPVTQRYLALDLLRPAAGAHNLPRGLLRGQTELESAYFVGAVNCRVPGAKDCFWTQRRIPDGSPESKYRDAAHGPTAFGLAAEQLRRRKDRYYDAAPQAIKDHEFMWKCAAGAHNWPAAAEKQATGGFPSWTYKADGRTYRVDDPAQWVKNIGVPGVETGRQWWDHYVRKVCAYVSEWSP